MEKYVINGGTALRGEVEISGAKNAAVAIIPAALIVDGVCRIENIPQISDTDMLLTILKELGAKIKFINNSTIEIDCTNVRLQDTPFELMRKIRASYYLIGAMLSRFGHAQVPMPGGCDLGDRPMDQHLKCFRALGAKCTIEHGIVDIKSDFLFGTQIYFDKVSVGATINAMLAAVKAEGLTILENAAKEPHIVDLANFLNSMGADIMGAGTDVIKIKGVSRLHGAEYTISPDQIEAGTFMIAVAATKGDALIKNVIPKHLEPITSKLRKIGVVVMEYDDSIRVIGQDNYERITVKTMPHPGFPTDMQPQLAALLTLAKGTSIINEGIFDNRFRYVDELRRMGADISVDGKVAVIEGVDHLTGAPVKAADLRAGAALIIAGLSTQGTTEIEDIYHIERGYENMDGKLRGLGADIVKRSFPDSMRKAL